jgi:hypothetical protein
LLQGCSNKSDTWYSYYSSIVTTLCRQPCNILVYHDCIRLVVNTLGPYDLYWVNESKLTLKRSLKNKICWWAYLKLCCVWMFSMQFITNFTIKTLFWEAEIFLKTCSQNAGNVISETQILKISWGACPQTPLANSSLRFSAHTFGDRKLSWGRTRKMGPLAVLFCPTTEESLKNALLQQLGQAVRRQLVDSLWTDL